MCTRVTAMANTDPCLAEIINTRVEIHDACNLQQINTKILLEISRYFVQLQFEPQQQRFLKHTLYQISP